MENKKASVESIVKTDGLKMVKNARIILSEDGKSVSIQHYSTVIFAYSPFNHVCEVKMNLSMTSNRMIRRAIEYFEIDAQSIKNVYEGQKWAYSGAFV